MSRRGETNPRSLRSLESRREGGTRRGGAPASALAAVIGWGCFHSYAAPRVLSGPEAEVRVAAMGVTGSLSLRVRLLQCPGLHRGGGPAAMATAGGARPPPGRQACSPRPTSARYRGDTARGHPLRQGGKGSRAPGCLAGLGEVCPSRLRPSELGVPGRARKGVLASRLGRPPASESGGVSPWAARGFGGWQ